MKRRKICMLFLGLNLCLWLAACSTTAFENAASYNAQVGEVLNTWFSSTSVMSKSSEKESSNATALEAPDGFSLNENGDYTFTGVEGADYYLLYLCAPDATDDRDAFLFSSDPLPSSGKGGETYSGNINDLVRYGYGEYLVKVFAFPNMNDSDHTMSTAATDSFSCSGAQDAPVIDFFWNAFENTMDLQLTNAEDYTYQAYPDRVEITFVNLEDSSDTLVLTMEDPSPDNNSLTTDLLKRGSSYQITAVSYNDQGFVTNRVSDTTHVAEKVTVGDLNDISVNYYYSDGITRMPFSYPQITQNLSLTEVGTLNSDNTAIHYHFTSTPTEPKPGSLYSFMIAADCRPFSFDDGTLELFDDGTFLCSQYGEMPPQGPSHIEGIWVDNGDGTVDLSWNHATLWTSVDG